LTPYSFDARETKRVITMPQPSGDAHLDGEGPGFDPLVAAAR
jgi:hypothetical protein